jgi:molecular chaperone GrpE
MRGKARTIDGEAEPTAPIEGNGAAPAEAPDLDAVVAERDEYLDQLQRSRAEFANYRRRTEQERAQVRQVANQALLAQLLPVLDDLQRALAAVPADQRESPLAQGVQLVERKFWNVLERAGVTPLDAVGQPFDPALHEAVELVPGTAADTVVDVYQTGYRLGQALLRPAMVKVGDASRQTPGAGRQTDGAGDGAARTGPGPHRC